MGEIPAGLLEAEHNRLLRTNPLYGLSLQMDDLAMRQEPSWNQDSEKETLAPIIEQPEWTKKQWDVVDQLLYEVRGWREKHARILKEIERMRTNDKKNIQPEKAYKGIDIEARN